jgi:cellulose synthase/poly-beta-1,6-N-acetylglucosamine synthase-like glycosyltransferase
LQCLSNDIVVPSYHDEMLVIRKPQMAVLAADFDDRTAEQLYSLLRERYPAVFAELGEERARARFRQGLDQAKAWGLELWYDIAVGVDLFFRHGSLEAPDMLGFREILERSDLDGSQKAAWVEMTIAHGG